jgi:hypothetical protein
MKNLPLIYLVANPPKLGARSVAIYQHWHRMHLLDFVEDDAARLSYPEQAHDCRDSNQKAQQPPIRTRKVEDVIVLYAL